MFSFFKKYFKSSSLFTFTNLISFSLTLLIINSLSTKICPELGFSTPAIILSEVDLPQPEGPRRQVTWPELILKEIPSTTHNLPNDRDRFFTSNLGKVSHLFKL